MRLFRLVQRTAPIHCRGSSLRSRVDTVPAGLGCIGAQLYPTQLIMSWRDLAASLPTNARPASNHRWRRLAVATQVQAP